MSKIGSRRGEGSTRSRRLSDNEHYTREGPRKSQRLRIATSAKKKFGLKFNFLSTKGQYTKVSKDYACDRCEKKFGQKASLALPPKNCTRRSERLPMPQYQSQTQSHLLRHSGARYENVVRVLSDDEVRYQVGRCQSPAFSCRIRTGQIVNFKHKDATSLHSFTLKTAFTIF
ncbi:unnamed protein product [Trichogramma brassicae]|uniref:C2H2-type domain-containing protein n=1 Tax=Trichogramma brassicae TaxID=86971 RepID=A0A6H5HYX9_9HYME|nr:unnamed protein product [Trichogramma brassicae]